LKFSFPWDPTLSFMETVTEWLAAELAFARGGSTVTTPFTGLYLVTRVS